MEMLPLGTAIGHHVDVQGHPAHNQSYVRDGHNQSLPSLDKAFWGVSHISHQQ